MLNQIALMGRLVQDPEIRYTQSQTAVAHIALAVTRDYSSGSTGEGITDVFDCIAWGSKAEFIGKYFKEGTAAIVTGRLQARDWTDKEGNKRRSIEIVVGNIYFGESKLSRAGQSSDISSNNKKGKVQDDSEEYGDLPF